MPIVLLEHINFKVPLATGESTIRSFYITTLGCPECPTGRLDVAVAGGTVPLNQPKQIHVNLGLSQLHFEWCTGSGVPYTLAQRFPGQCILEVDSLQGLMHRLHQASHPYRLLESNQLELTCPFGSRWICRPASLHVRSLIEKTLPIRPGGTGHVLGLSRVEFLVQPGLARPIALFYQTHFSATAQSTDWGSQVHTSAGQVIAFRETPSAPPPDAYERLPTDYGIHLCIYVSDFELRCHDMQPLFWINPDYCGPPLNDCVDTAQAALQRRQFRIKHIGPLFVLEHEVRGLSHPLAPLRFAGL